MRKHPRSPTSAVMGLLAMGCVNNEHSPSAVHVYEILDWEWEQGSYIHWRSGVYHDYWRLQRGQFPPSTYSNLEHSLTPDRLEYWRSQMIGNKVGIVFATGKEVVDACNLYLYQQNWGEYYTKLHVKHFLKH